MEQETCLKKLQDIETSPCLEYCIRNKNVTSDCAKSEKHTGSFNSQRYDACIARRRADLFYIIIGKWRIYWHGRLINVGKGKVENRRSSV
jgi:hypothetical protein